MKVLWFSDSNQTNCTATIKQKFLTHIRPSSIFSNDHIAVHIIRRGYYHGIFHLFYGIYDELEIRQVVFYVLDIHIEMRHIVLDFRLVLEDRIRIDPPGAIGILYMIPTFSR